MKRAAVILALVLTACSAPQRPAVSRAGFDDAGSPQIEQSGPVSEPATISTDELTVTLPVPAGSVVEVRDVSASEETPASSVLSVEVSQDTELRVHRRAVAISGAKSYPPPSGPSPGEKTAARWAWLWRAGLFAGLALAGLGVWWKGGLVIAGGLSVAGASAFGWFVEENPWLLWVFGGGVFLAALGFALWHLWLKKRQGLIEKNPAASAAVASPL